MRRRVPVIGASFDKRIIALPQRTSAAEARIFVERDGTAKSRALPKPIAAAKKRN
jgi:hypothetical protein